MRTHPPASKRQHSNRRDVAVGSSARNTYPFVAIVGQQEMKLALILNVIDPLIGGVLIMGHRGTGKSTAVRGLSELVPRIKVVNDCNYRCDPTNYDNLCNDCSAKHRSEEKLKVHSEPVKVVELPLGATEDRVCGSINFERALKEGATTLQPGLLAQANRGFLYIDEVNLLDDHLVDVLLDVAASGWNRVEREGVSAEHPARFVLIGSGNPEEGELRPQLLDRFGLYVEIKTEERLETRIAVAQHRESFDRDPETFARRFASEQQELAKAIASAQRNVNKIQIDANVLEKIARLCADLKVEGHRGELTTMRAARALAALEGRKRITDADVQRVAPMALQHRLRHNVFEDSSTRDRVMKALEQTTSISPKPERRDKVDLTGNGQRHSAGEKSKGSSALEKYDDGSGRSVEMTSDPPVNTATKLKLQWKPNRQGTTLRDRSSSGVKRTIVSEQRGRHSRSVAYKTAASKIAVAATLRALLATSASDLSQSDHAPPLRYKLFSRKRGTLFIFVIDTSGSMGRHRIALAKGAILDLLRQSYLNRDSVAIITFRGDSASVALPPSRSILRARRSIDALTVGGPTPLSAGLMCAAELVRGIKDQHADKSVLVFTDGRANVPITQTCTTSPSREHLIENELKELGGLIRRTGTKLVVLDTQRFFERSDEPVRLAQLMEAELMRLEQPDV